MLYLIAVIPPPAKLPPGTSKEFAIVYGAIALWIVVASGLELWKRRK